MKHSKYLAGSLVLASMMTGVAQAQLGDGWFFRCIDPEIGADAYSVDYGIQRVGNDLMAVTMGVSGSVTWGGAEGPCYAPEGRTLDAPGRFAFAVGPVGSVQSDFDDNMALTTGAPIDAAGDFTFGRILIDGQEPGDSELFGTGGLRAAFIGASDRYGIVAWRNPGDDVDVEVEVKVIGDAVRMRWRMTNLQADVAELGLLFGSYVGQRTTGGRVDVTGADQANSLLGTLGGTPKRTPDRFIGFTEIPTGRPVRNERRYAVDNPRFPNSVNFRFGQTQYYGVRVDNTPGTDTRDATGADLFLIGNHGYFTSPGLLFGNAMRLFVFGDFAGNPNPHEEADITLNETSFIQRFPAVGVQPGAFRDVVHYIRSTWSVAEYNDPYAFVLDVPQLIATDPADLDELTPNPARVRAYLDNQYATLDREVDLRNVEFTILLPDGLTLAPGESQQKTIDRIVANRVGFVEWSVVPDNEVAGDLPVSVRVAPTPGPTRTLTGMVRVAATPRIRLGEGANLVSFPFEFTDTSMDAILDLQAGVDYLAYRWDPDTFSYTPAPSVERGQSYWIIPTTDLGIRALQGARLSTDQAQGGLIVSVDQGWNLIANPYNYEIRLSDMIAVAEDNPDEVFTWSELVQNNFVQSSLAYFERDPSLPGGGAYRYTVGQDARLQPARGYWLFVSTYRPIRLVYPPLFTVGLPDSGRSEVNRWRQSERQWRLQLSARNAEGIDSQNFVGVLADAKQARNLEIIKPPASPSSRVELAVMDEVAGKQTRMAQAFAERQGRKEWRVSVKSEIAGDVTVTWPNLPSVPRNMRFRLTDIALGETRDLRAASGYTFRMSEAGTREFKLVMEPGGSSRAVIGNVVVSGGSRSGDSAMTITYALSSDATTTVRVLSGAGREVFVVTRGRSDASGENSVTWMMRDSANRAVAPGSYRVEILAETSNGERVRKIVPVNVVR